MSWLLLYWPVSIILTALLQGLLLPAIRRTPQGDEAKRQSFALHVLGSLVYFLPLVLVPVWQHAVSAVVARVVLFDPVLNLAADTPLLQVGRTAFTDRLLRKLAPRRPELLSVGVKLVVLVLSFLLLVYA